MNLFHAVISCQQDDGHVAEHVRRVDQLELPIGQRWFYYGQTLDSPVFGPYWTKDGECRLVLPFRESYENLP